MVFAWLKKLFGGSKDEAEQPAEQTTSEEATAEQASTEQASEQPEEETR